MHNVEHIHGYKNRLLLPNKMTLLFHEVFEEGLHLSLLTINWLEERRHCVRCDVRADCKRTLAPRNPNKIPPHLLLELHFAAWLLSTS